jgi:hypothetical protein
MSKENIDLKDLYVLLCRGKREMERDRENGIKDLSKISIPSYYALDLFIDIISGVLDGQKFILDLQTGEIFPFVNDS